MKFTNFNFMYSFLPSFSSVDGDESVAKAKEVMQPIADEFKKSPDASRLYFFVADFGGDVSKHYLP